MAILDEAARFDLWAEYMRDLSRRREQVGPVTKQELRRAVDRWADAAEKLDAADLDAALPEVVAKTGDRWPPPVADALDTRQRGDLVRRVVEACKPKEVARGPDV